MVDAVRGDRRLRLTHRRPDGRTTKKTADPLGLVAKAGVWYLVARSRDGIRAHRASRIAGVERPAGTFSRPADFDLAEFWTRWTAEFEASLDQLPVTVRVRADALAALPAIRGDTSCAARATPDPEDCWHRLTLHFDSPLAARRRLLGFGPDLEVLEPADVRADLARTARRIVGRYGH